VPCRGGEQLLHESQFPHAHRCRPTQWTLTRFCDTWTNTSGTPSDPSGRRERARPSGRDRAREPIGTGADERPSRAAAIVTGSLES
jgi:hypothetical protein